MAASKRMKKGKTPEVHKPNVSGKIKEHAPRSEHVHLHQAGHWLHTRKPATFKPRCCLNF
jgi:hypothetical protein